MITPISGTIIPYIKQPTRVLSTAHSTSCSSYFRRHETTSFLDPKSGEKDVLTECALETHETGQDTTSPAGSDGSEC